MRLILIGPPGSGKGTQAKLLSQRLGLSHISTGDILRDAVRQDSPMGRLAKTYVTAGQLVPDDLVNDIVAARFRTDDRPERFVLDGYPRTLAQAASFDQVLRQQFLDLNAAVYLAVADEEIIRRLSGRWNCPNTQCKATFHTLFKPSKVSGKCDECGSPLVQRDDDKEDTIRKRLIVYHKITADLLDHYRRLSLLHEVQGSGDIEKIYGSIVRILPEGK